ncbi:MAG TPA: hypothetical protein PKD54_05445, partial [Pirellulaceae bacterium]|nr:hypothetical protein [Pirellulaceae bacterium]
LIVRDGRAVLRSTQEIIERGGPRWQRMWEKMWEATLWEWPAYLEKWPWVASKLLGRTHRFWGTRPPGWREWLSQLAPEVFFARQWAATMDVVMRDFQGIPEANRRIVHYEHLMSASAEDVRQLVTFTGTEDVDRVVEALLQTREPARHESWREAYQPHELEALRSELEPTLNRLGYTW